MQNESNTGTLELSLIARTCSIKLNDGLPNRTINVNDLDQFHHTAERSSVLVFSRKRAPIRIYKATFFAKNVALATYRVSIYQTSDAVDAVNWRRRERFASAAAALSATICSLFSVFSGTYLNSFCVACTYRLHLPFLCKGCIDVTLELRLIIFVLLSLKVELITL